MDGRWLGGDWKCRRQRWTVRGDRIIVARDQLLRYIRWGTRFQTIALHRKRVAKTTSCITTDTITKNIITDFINIVADTPAGLCHE